MRYSLITLSCDKLPVTRRCLSALLRHTHFDGDTELIVVDNGSRDGSSAWLGAELPRLGAAGGVEVHVVANAANIGCSTARNQALAMARGRYVVFCDNDVEPRSRRWLTSLRERIASDKRIGLAGAKLVYPYPPYAIQCAGVGISRRGHVCFRGRGEARDHPGYNLAEPVQCLISACLMVRGDLIRAHGGFDEAFNPVQFEDFDLCYRLRAQGWTAWYEPAAEMYHFESVTTQGTSVVRNAAVVVRNGLRFQRRWRHMFEQERGPSESDCRWRRLPAPPENIPEDLPRL
ncbi:MAG: glycosyltransferase family 2 protein [Kiritimatiellae bacterium]|nr:glycosyltransferase family 2 protein [Kiritimatiellia bacterium]